VNAATKEDSFTGAISALRPRDLTHVEITVSNLDRSLRFYRDVLGLVESPIPSGVDPADALNGDDLDGTNEFPNRKLRFAVLRYATTPNDLPFSPGYEPCGIVLIQPFDPAPSGKPIKVDQIGISHISILMDGVFEDVQARIVAAGAKIVGRQTAKDPQHPSKSIFVEDPDGILIQLDVLH
jgi:catechol 2,3-dioxygenase-like lactoylglutathione lyase family enzyme